MWLPDTLGLLKSDEEILGALQVLSLEMNPKATEFLFHQSVIAIEKDFKEFINNLKASKKSNEYLGLVANDTSGYGTISSNQRDKNNNIKSNHHGIRNTNAIFNAKKYTVICF